MKKVITLGLAIILCLLLVLPSNSYATGTAIKDYFEHPNSTLKFENVSSQIYVVLRTFGLVLAICILVTISISYMLATPNKRAVLKERLVYYVAGVVFLIGGIGFLGAYEKIAKEIGDGASGGGHYSDPAAQQVLEFSQLAGRDVVTMSDDELESFIYDLEYSLYTMKSKLNSGEIPQYSTTQATIAEAENKLELARTRLKDRKKSSKYLDDIEKSQEEKELEISQNY